MGNGFPGFQRDHAFNTRPSRFEVEPRLTMWDHMACNHDGNQFCIDRRIVLFRRTIGTPTAIIVDAAARSFPFYVGRTRAYKSISFRISANVANAKIRFGIHSAMKDRMIAAGGNLVYNFFMDKILWDSDEIDASLIGPVTLLFQAPLTLRAFTPYFFTLVGNNSNTPSIVHHPNTGCDPVWSAESLANYVPAANSQTPKGYVSGSVGSAIAMGNADTYPSAGWSASRTTTLQHPYITLNY